MFILHAPNMKKTLTDLFLIAGSFLVPQGLQLVDQQGKLVPGPQHSEWFALYPSGHA